MACDNNGGIGSKRGIPWSPVPEDMHRFKQLTQNHIVVMGSGTWNSYGMKKPLPKRTNVVVTSRPNTCEGADQYISGNVVEQIQQIQHDNPDKHVWIIGGGKLIEQCLPIIDKWYITRIGINRDCDVFIPKIWDDPAYKLLESVAVNNKTITIVPRYYCDMTFETWERTAKNH